MNQHLLFHAILVHVELFSLFSIHMLFRSITCALVPHTLTIRKFISFVFYMAMILNIRKQNLSSSGFCFPHFILGMLVVVIYLSMSRVQQVLFFQGCALLFVKLFPPTFSISLLNSYFFPIKWHKWIEIVSIIINLEFIRERDTFSSLISMLNFAPIITDILLVQKREK